MGLALLVQEPAPRRRASSARSTSCPARSASPPRRCCSTASTARAAPLDDLLQTLGIVDEPVGWLGTPNTALFSTIAMVIWRFAGFNMLILLTGLQSIPTDVYEAARIDGASRWQMFRHITLPLLRPTIALMLDPQHHRLAAGLRPVLHPHPRRPGRQHGQHRAWSSTARRSRASTSARRRRSRSCCWSSLVVLNVAPAARACGRGSDHEDRPRPAVPATTRPRRARRPVPVPAACGAASRRSRASRAARRRPASASATTRRWPTTARASATYLFNTDDRVAADRRRDAGRLDARRLRVRALPLPRQEPAVPGHARRS